MNMRTKREKHFKAEADLCAAFLARVGDAWTPYAETAGWDILLVRKSDGFQIGIEAKLKFNAHVMSQAVEQYGSMGVEHAGPDCRAILIPADEQCQFAFLAPYVGITVIRVYGVAKYATFNPSLPSEKGRWQDDWHEWCPTKRHALPEYVPDVTAGSPAPLQLTQWKIAAIKIAVTLEKRGYVTRSDFKKHGIDHRRWLAPNSWLRPQDGKYVAGTMPDFKSQHPTVYEQIAADAAKWMAEPEHRLV